MTKTQSLATRRLLSLVALLDIPDSHYRLAIDRYKSVGEWLLRPESTVARYEPAVCAQGSFRYGTVNRPLFKRDEYDLDAVAELVLITKDDGSQEKIKQMLGEEIKSYAAARQFKSPPTEKHRCWRLDYADGVCFHMDILPAIPEDEHFKDMLIRLGISPELAVLAIAITDDRHPQYEQIQRDWPRSNPRGFAKWFEGRMRVQAELQLEAMLHQRALASIDEVPAWEWKTPLQRAIQILKRHRDVMFKDNCDVAPISMIITTLSADAYKGESDLHEALTGILDRMPDFVPSGMPRVPNPVNPGEDFADRWRSDPRLEINFWKWHARAQADLETLDGNLNLKDLEEFAYEKLRLTLPEDEGRVLASGERGSSLLAISVAPIVIAAAPRPWGR